MELYMCTLAEHAEWLIGQTAKGMMMPEKSFVSLVTTSLAFAASVWVPKCIAIPS